MSTDGGVLERPVSDAEFDETTLPGGNGDGNGARPPGSVRGRDLPQPPPPDGRVPRDLLVLLVGFALSFSASDLSAWLDIPIWSQLIVFAAGVAGFYFLCKPGTLGAQRVAVADPSQLQRPRSSLRASRLAVSVLFAGTVSAGIAGGVILNRLQCSNAVGRGLDPASGKAFETAYSRGGHERFGCPKGDAFIREGGSFQMFSGGRAGPGVMAGEPKEPPVPVFGGLWRAYEAIGDGVRNTATWAGIPTESTKDGTSRVVYLSDGECGEGGLYRPRRGVVYWVVADIFEEYVSRGGHHGFLGFPVSDPVIKGRRVKQRFDGGVIFAKVGQLRDCYSLA